MSPLLPPVRTLDEYRPLMADDALCLPAVRVVCERHGLDPGGLRRTQLGSNLVWA